LLATIAGAHERAKIAPLAAMEPEAFAPAQQSRRSCEIRGGP
jgi:hypothetical protein